MLSLHLCCWLELKDCGDKELAELAAEEVILHQERLAELEQQLMVYYDSAMPPLINTQC